MGEELRVDPTSFEFRHNSIAIYKRLLREQPVCKLENGGILLCRHADVERVLTDLKAFRRPYEWSMKNKPEGPFREFGRNNMLALNPPDNTRYRRAMARAFAPRRIDLLNADIQTTCDKLIDRMAAKPECDFIKDFALPLPVAIICQMLGIPVKDQDLFAEWSARVLAGMEISATPEEKAEAQTATLALFDYLAGIADERRNNAGEDLISTLVEAAEAEKLRPDEVVWGAITLLIAGHETTTHLLGNGMLALIRNPDQMQLLRERPELTQNAVEEFLRYDPSVYVLFREAAEDVEIDGTPIAKGTLLTLSLAAANRDPRVFEDPDRLDITRANAKAHLSFGVGFHLCLGQAVARVEARIAFETLMRRIDTITLAEEPTPRDGLMFKGNHEMPVRYQIAA